VSDWSLTWKAIGRNDPCWCGRKRKYKRCHLPIEEEDRPERTRNAETRLSPLAFGHKHLYHYTTTANLGWIEEILLESKIYLRLPSELNDPFEARISSDISGTLEERRRFYFNKVKFQLGLSDREACSLTDKWLNTGEHEDPAFWRNEEKLLFEQARESDFRVFCLTPYRDNLLMWSHYGAGHKGICLRFRTEGGFDKALKVDYVVDYPRTSFLFGSSRFEQLKSFVLTKSDVWSYESEFRLWRCKDRSGQSPFHTHSRFDPDLLDGVILGTEIQGDCEAAVLDMVDKRDTPTEVLRARRSETEFTLEFENVGLASGS